MHWLDFLNAIYCFIISFFKSLFHHHLFCRLTIAIMARVFNIYFNHNGKSYSALVSVNGKEDASIKVMSNNDRIQVLLPTGSLSFSIADVLQTMYATMNQTSNATFHVTPNISLQLLHTDWDSSSN
jgi:hypothetical protein